MLEHLTCDDPTLLLYLVLTYTYTYILQYKAALVSPLRTHLSFGNWHTRFYLDTHRLRFLHL